MNPAHNRPRNEALAPATLGEKETTMNAPTISTHTLGLIAMVGAPAMLLEAARHGFQKTMNEDTDVLGALLYAAFSVGWLCAMIGLRRLRATGRGPVGRVIATLPVVTISLAVMQSLMDILRVSTANPLYVVTDLAWPLSMLLTFVVSVAALFARELPGLARLVPLLCGISLPLTIVVMGVTGQDLPMWVFGWHTAVGWALLGFILLGARPNPARRVALSAR